MNRAKITELECFVAVAEELNFSRAAHRLHLSQPPLSRQIQALEEKLGVRLLERSTRNVALTSAGRLYLQDARQILTQMDSAAHAVGRVTGGEVERLRLAFVGALLDEGLVAFLQAFRQSHPHCQIHLEDLPPAAQLEALREGQIDGAFIGATPDQVSRDLRTLIWKREPLLVALPAGHALAAADKALPLSRLKREGWVMVSRSAAPAFRRQFDALCRKEKFSPRVVQESDRVPAVLTMVAAAQGISLLPESVTRLIRHGVVFLPLSGKAVQLAHTFAWPVKNAAPAILDFVALLRRGHAV